MVEARGWCGRREGKGGGGGGARVGDRWPDWGGAGAVAESRRPRSWKKLQVLITSRERPRGGAGALCNTMSWSRPPRKDRSTI